MYKIKRFSASKIGYREKYKSTSSRLKSAAKTTALGAGVGAMLGGLISPRGAKKLGAGIGAAVVGAFGARTDWKSTSKSSVDKRNKEREARDKKILSIINNPAKYLTEHLGQDWDFSKLEKLIGCKMPSELYKLMKVNKQFIPIAAKLMKERQTLWVPEYEVSNPQYIINDIESIGLDDSLNDGLIIMYNPEMADDTWIVWYPKTNTYDFDFRQEGKGKYKSLKSILIQALEWELEYYDDTYELENDEEDPAMEITRQYLTYIKSKL